MNNIQGTILIVAVCVGIIWNIFFDTPRTLEDTEAIKTSILNLEAQSKQTQVWEYKIETVSDTQFTAKMNELGQNGWELVFARRASDGSTYSPTFSYEIIFKKPKKIQ